MTIDQLKQSILEGHTPTQCTAKDNDTIIAALCDIIRLQDLTICEYSSLTASLVKACRRNIGNLTHPDVVALMDKVTALEVVGDL